MKFDLFDALRHMKKELKHLQEYVRLSVDDINSDGGYRITLSASVPDTNEFSNVCFIVSNADLFKDNPTIQNLEFHRAVVELKTFIQNELNKQEEDGDARLIN